MSNSGTADLKPLLLAALEHERRINLHTDRIDIEVAGDTLVLTGEVADIAAKRLTLESAAALPGVTGIVDRLHVRPTTAMGDGEIADHLERAMIREPAFEQLSIVRVIRSERSIVRDAPGGPYDWYLEIRVEDGVVTLDGEVPSLSHKRLAGALAWWVPGSRDVVNGLGVEPPEDDSDAEILDALRLVLEKDPLVDASQVTATCERAVITLKGLVPNGAQKDLVEFDAWALFGVDRVSNEIETATG